MNNYVWDKKFLKGNFGIEKESLRINFKGEIAKTRHPFKDKFKNPYIKVDFAEQQVEVVTGVNKTIRAAIKEIQLLTNIVYRHMNKNEVLLNYSMPFLGIKNAKMATGDKEQLIYRKKLLKNSKYEAQLISGVHFNFSFPKSITKKMSDPENNEFYFNILRKYTKYSFLITQMFGMSPTKDFKTFDLITYRQSQEFGYVKKLPEKAYDSYLAYHETISKLIKNKKISEWREVYDTARPKPFKAKRIEWLEIRNIDLDYTKSYGLAESKLRFIHQFLLFLAFNNLGELNIENPKSQFDFNSALTILKKMQAWMNKNNIKDFFISKYIKKMSQNKYDACVKPNIKKIIETQIKIAKEVRTIPLKPIEDMELSTQILIEQAYINGQNIKILSKTKNIIEINKVKIKMATLTPFDSKKGLEIISSKVKTNQFLKKHNFESTNQQVYYDKDSAIDDFDQWANRKIVIKPVNTNFSNGLTVFENSKFNKKDYQQAIKFAFTFDHEIIIEDFVEGQEYRFLVINNKLIGILLRIPANIVGDGKHTIEELVKIKNKNPLRGQNYKLPLEKIKINKIEKDFLKYQSKNIKFIPKEGELVYLRKNSNVSTGGDTIDVTDQVPEKYKKIALEIVKKLNLAICGLDIIIPKLDKFSKYTVLELNWNPAIHIHTYPLKGKNREAAKAILNLIKKYQ